MSCAAVGRDNRVG